MDAIYEGLLQAHRQGEGAVLVTVVETRGSAPGRAGAKMLVRATGQTVGTVGGGALEREATARARALLAARRPELARYALTEDDQALEGEVIGMACGGAVTLFYDYVGHSHYAYVLGGGHVGRAVARALGPLPYHVTVIDPRPEAAEGLVGADRVISADYITALEGAGLAPGGFYVIATPSHEADYEVLRHIIQSGAQPAYVGMIGSSRKARASLGRLRDELGHDAPWDALYTPIGLDVGGPTPEEIAISIAAEMQSVRYGKAGHRHMRLGRPSSSPSV